MATEITTISQHFMTMHTTDNDFWTSAL